MSLSQELQDGRSLLSYGITEGANLDVLARLQGGAKKRKKKTYTKPKKQKRKPKKIKLRILKYYKVLAAFVSISQGSMYTPLKSGRHAKCDANCLCSPQQPAAL